MTATKLYDVLVVGGGPAGLGSTLAIARLHRSVAMFDHGVYRNQASNAMHTVVGVVGLKPSDWLARGRSQLQKDAGYGDWIDIVSRKVTAIQPVPSPTPGQTRFELVDASGEKWRGRKVILANGVTDVMPNIPGFAELWGKSIAHCVFCHGQELCEGSNPHLGVLMTANPASNGMLLHSLNNFSKLIPGNRVTVLANGHWSPDEHGNMPTSSGMSAEVLALLKARKSHFNFERITSFIPGTQGHVINFASGASLSASGTLYQPEVRANNMFGLATPPKSMFDAPIDLAPGVTVAGNANTQYIGVSAAEADGVLSVARGAGMELANEDAAADVAAA